jgi:hypothetical protein
MTSDQAVLHVTDHAIEALRLFYPRADILTELRAAVEAPPVAARGLLGRLSPTKPNGSRYLIHRERTGIFALDGRVVVTFLRFYSRLQWETASRLWPGGDEPTADVHWVRQLAGTPDPAAAQEHAATIDERRLEKAAAQRAAADQELAEKRAERRRRGVEQAAALLRRHGWTCTPPEGA